MQHGFIYPAFNALIKLMFALNFIEIFKIVLTNIFVKFCFENDYPERRRYYSNIAIDIYQLSKFLIVFFLWYKPVSHDYALYLVCYMIWSNVFTYFYHHVWSNDYKISMTKDAVNRRFMNMLFAIAFYLIAYAYLYQVHFSQQITWPKDNDVQVIDALNAIYLSMSTAFTLTYGGFQPETQTIRLFFMSQLINTFLFFTIIVANSIPNHISGNRN